MNTRLLSARPRSLPSAALTAGLVLAGLATALGLAGCGGGGGYTELAVSQTGERRALPQSLVTRAAVNYSPYRTARNESELAGEVITPANVLQDLRLVQATGIGTIRLFTSNIFAETVLKVIQDNGLDLKVMLGAYPNPVGSAAAEANNQAELDACIRLAKDYRSIVAAVSVGNETMVEWSAHKIDPVVMAGYLRKVRAAIEQPVTTDDNWLFWATVPKVIAEVVDFAAVHTYPVLDTFYNPSEWDWRQKNTPVQDRAQAMIDASIAEAKEQFGKARAGLDKLGLGSLPMIIGETGWSAVDTPGGPTLNLRAHPVNQRMYFDALQSWAAQGRSGNGPQAIFYFQAFDEPWKQGDDGWGLFNTQRQARYVVQGLGTCGVTWACESGSYTMADAVKWQLPALNPEVTADRYTLLSEAVVAGEAVASGLKWDPFALTGYATVAGGAPNDGATSFEVTPNPLDYGWGLFLYSNTGITANLKAFENGHLNFAVKSDSYPGRIEIGISSDTDDRDAQEAFVQIGPGDYGYCNRNAWCEVSIPLSAFRAANPKLDLRYVSSRFIIADRFSFTGKPLNQAGLPPIRIDGIHWSK